MMARRRRSRPSRGPPSTGSTCLSASCTRSASTPPTPTSAVASACRDLSCSSAGRCGAASMRPACCDAPRAARAEGQHTVAALVNVPWPAGLRLVLGDTRMAPSGRGELRHAAMAASVGVLGCSSRVGRGAWARLVSPHPFSLACMLCESCMLSRVLPRPSMLPCVTVRMRAGRRSANEGGHHKDAPHLPAARTRL